MSRDLPPRIEAQHISTLDYSNPGVRRTNFASDIAWVMVLGVAASFLALSITAPAVSIPAGADLRVAILCLVAFTAFAIASLVAGVMGIHEARKAGTGGWQSKTAVLVGFFATAWGVFAAISWTHDPHRNYDRTKCASNLRQIGMGMLIYANDKGGKFPARLGELITEADLNPEIFVCPHSLDSKATGATTQQMLADFAKPGRCSYIYLGAGLTNSTVTPKHVLAHEPFANHEKEGGNFLMGDFTVQWVKGKAAEKMIRQLEAGINPAQP